MDKDKNKKDDWIRLASKSRPGRFYLFNKATGETHWLPFKETDDKKQGPPPKLSINKGNKTPAQDRLKRLQHTLKVCQTKPQATRHTSAVNTKTSKEQENDVGDAPSTSSTAKNLAKSPKKDMKRFHSASLSNEIDNPIKRFKSSVIDTPKELHLQGAKIGRGSTTAYKHSALETFTEGSHSSTRSITNENLPNVWEIRSSTFSNLRYGIIKKIKEFCKIPFTASKKLDDKKLLLKEDKSISVIKNTSKTKVKQCLSTPTKQTAIITQIKDEILKTPENKILTNTFCLNTPKNHTISAYPRGSANSRLERLKQSLLSQQKPCNTLNNSDTMNTVPNESIANNNNITASLKERHCLYNTDNSYIKLSNNSANEVEAMDWQPVVEEESATQQLSSEATLVVEKSKKFLLTKTNANESQTMGDIIDAVNENLLRLSAEKQKDSSTNNKKWRKDFYYFIVDTNVLLRDLTFMEDLTKMKLCGTKGSMLYIPYSVLQELDKLKMRFGLQEGVKTLAVRAIKYLNSKFEHNSPNVQAQSAVDERRHLIDINSADDSIINSCLQAKQHIANLLLLTEDVNLRNKAICNNIIVSTKSDLVAKRYDSRDIS